MYVGTEVTRHDRVNDKNFHQRVVTVEYTKCL